MINGDGSYYPEGHKKDPDALLEDLTVGRLEFVLIDESCSRRNL